MWPRPRGERPPCPEDPIPGPESSSSNLPVSTACALSLLAVVLAASGPAMSSSGRRRTGLIDRLWAGVGSMLTAEQAGGQESASPGRRWGCRTSYPWSAASKTAAIAEKWRCPPLTQLSGRADDGAAAGRDSLVTSSSNTVFGLSAQVIILNPVRRQQLQQAPVSNPCPLPASCGFVGCLVHTAEDEVPTREQRCSPLADFSSKAYRSTHRDTGNLGQNSACCTPHIPDSTCQCRAGCPYKRRCGA